eukprot:gene37995-biopygen25212
MKSRLPQNPALPRGLPHPRNRHRDRYDFPALLRASPALAPFVVPHPLAGDTINFSDPAAVRALNRALLLADYGLAHWDIPPGEEERAVEGADGGGIGEVARVTGERMR